MKIPETLEECYKVLTILENLQNLHSYSYPNMDFARKLDDVLKKLERERLLEKRKEKINKINEKNN